MTVELQQSDSVMTSELEPLSALSSHLNRRRLQKKHLHRGRTEGLWHYYSLNSSLLERQRSLKLITDCMEDLSHSKLVSKVGKADIHRQFDGRHPCNNGFCGIFVLYQLSTGKEIRPRQLLVLSFWKSCPTTPNIPRRGRRYWEFLLHLLLLAHKRMSL